MTTPEFDPERSAAIRAGLATTVEKADRMPAPGWRALAAVALAGVLVGGAVTAAVAANLPEPEERASASGTAPVLPEGLLPGAPIITLLGESTSTVVSTPVELALAPPAEATDVRVTVTCLTTGWTYWGFDPEGNNPSSSCAEGERSDAFMDFSLDLGETLFVTPDAGTEVIVTTQFLHSVQTDWGVNAKGQTYGVTKPGAGDDPDLISAVGVDGTIGYVSGEELDQVNGTVDTIEEALRTMEDNEPITADYQSGGATVPLYESDGTTVIGEFRVG
jgi:hypothetical protein